MKYLKYLLESDYHVIWFEKVEELHTWQWERDTKYFIKGSRSMKLEKILPQEFLEKI